LWYAIAVEGFGFDVNVSQVRWQVLPNEIAGGRRLDHCRSLRRADFPE
jgi:hypothetical protein